jgi:hypothetical protein
MMQEIERMREEIERLKRGGKLETPLDYKWLFDTTLEALRPFPDARVALAQALRDHYTGRPADPDPDWQAVRCDLLRGLAEILTDQPTVRQQVEALFEEQFKRLEQIKKQQGSP